jgi:GTPase SAR1 family protein
MMATAGRASDPAVSAEFVACVVGLSRPEGESFTEQRGIGKSCLCCRFIHPDFEDYTDQHESLLALHEFTDPVINNVHFLYWGTIDRNLPTKSNEKSVPVKFHIIEQTVFYQDETSQPFSCGTKPDSIEQYNKRITGSIECPGKLSYASRNDIEIQSALQKQQYPARLRRLPRGFLVVVDVSLKGESFTKQLSRVEKILDHLVKQKQKFIIVATKRDESNAESLEQTHKLKRKYRGTLLVETSASKNINIGDAFRLAALKALHKKSQGISDIVPDYEDPSVLSTTDRQAKADHRSKRYSMPLLSTLRVTEPGGSSEHRYSLVGTEEEGVESFVTEIEIEEDENRHIDEKIPSCRKFDVGESEADISIGQEILEGKKDTSTSSDEKPSRLVQNSPDLIE